MKKKRELKPLPFSIIFMIISYIIIFYYMKTHFEFTLAEINLFLTPSKFVEICNNFTRENLTSYFIMITTLDIIWPISYCSFFFFLNYKINKNSKRFLFNILLVTTFFIDMLENISTFKYLQTTNNIFIYPSIIATNLKWFLILVVSIYLIYKTILYIKNKRSIKLLTE